MGFNVSVWLEDGKASQSKRSRRRPLITAHSPHGSVLTRAPDAQNARRSRSPESARLPISSSRAPRRIARCWNRRSPISIAAWRLWKIPNPKSQIPSPNKRRPPKRFGICNLELGAWDLFPSPLPRVPWNAASFDATTPISELFEREAAGDELSLELRLQRGARGVVLELVRGLSVARPVNEQARSTFRSCGANEPHRLGAAREQPDCLDEPGHQARQSIRQPRAQAMRPPRSLLCFGAMYRYPRQ
jgi:hypothetical protein